MKGNSDRENINICVKNLRKTETNNEG